MDQKKGSGSSKKKQKQSLTKGGGGGVGGGKQQKKANPSLTLTPPQPRKRLLKSHQQFSCPKHNTGNLHGALGLSDNDYNIDDDFLVKHDGIQGE